MQTEKTAPKRLLPISRSVLRIPPSDHITAPSGHCAPSPVPAGAMSASGASAKALLKNAWRVTKQVALQKSRTELCAIESTGDAP